MSDSAKGAGEDEIPLLSRFDDAFIELDSLPAELRDEWQPAIEAVVRENLALAFEQFGLCGEWGISAGENGERQRLFWCQGGPLDEGPQTLGIYDFPVEISLSVEDVDDAVRWEIEHLGGEMHADIVARAATLRALGEALLEGARRLEKAAEDPPDDPDRRTA